LPASATYTLSPSATTAAGSENRAAGPAASVLPERSVEEIVVTAVVFTSTLRIPLASAWAT
jgi:hypothetical protein